MAWHTSTRRTSLPKDWASRVRTVWARDHGLCRWPVGDTQCGAPGRDVDHKRDRNDHRIESLWLLCGPHHDAKTHAESMASRPTLKRPPEAHPGIL
jgi:5-methylcytosine-specific restriction protein A